jgi:hypothetical protein
MSDNKSIFNNHYSDQQAESIDQAKFDELKAEAIANEQRKQTMSLKNIELTPELLANQCIGINGNTVPAEPGFFKGLAKILKVNATLEKSLRKTDDGSGTEFYAKMIGALKTFQASVNDKPVTLIASDESKSVTNIIQGDSKRLTNEGLFNIADRLLNDYPNLSIYDVKREDSDVGIKLINKDVTDFGNFGGPDGGQEIFQFGMNLENSGLTTKLGDFAYRMVCANGMMGMKTINNFMMQGTDTENIRKLLEHIQEVEERGFLPYAFQEHIELASKINASMREVEMAFGNVHKQLKIEDADLKDHFSTALQDQYFRGLRQAREKVTKAGFDPNELTTKQMAFVDSGMNMWELINNMTWLGSHNSGFQFENREQLQKIGGKQFHEEYDLAYSGLMKL